MKKILVAYASKYGSTKEIAIKISEAIQAAGCQVKILEADSVKDIKAYNAVVIGSGVYMGRWLKSAFKLVKKNKNELKEIPVWFFSTGPTGEGDPLIETKGWIFPKNLTQEADFIQPKDKALFRGVIHKERLSGMHKWMIEKVGAKEGDYRDWDRIKGWAEGIAKSVK